MKKLYATLLPVCVALAISAPGEATALTADQARTLLHPDQSARAVRAHRAANPLDINTARYQGLSNRQQQIDRVNALLNKGENQPRFVGQLTANQAGTDYQPQYKIENADMYGDLDGPGGSIWYWTLKYNEDIIQHEYWTEHVLRGYTFEIFDDKMQSQGTITDVVTYREHETRVVSCDVAPIVTRHFFNDDDRYEIMVGLIINTDYYVNQYRNKVYSLGGATDADGNSVAVAEMDQLLADVLDASQPGGEEEIYMAFSGGGNDYVPVDENDSYDDITTNYWAKYISNYSTVDIYGRATAATGKPELLYQRKIRLVEMPGDQQDTPMMISYMHNGRPTYLFQQYDQPFYNELSSFMDDMSQRADNTLTIEILELQNGKMNTVQSTRIPVNKIADETVAGSYFSTGMLRYRDDIDYTNYNSGDKAAFVITREDYTSSSDSYVNSYYVYNPDGTQRATIFEKADGVVGLSDIKGYNPQYMFVSIDPVNGDYIFNYVDLKECKTVMSIDYQLQVEDGDPDKMTSNMDRVAVGDSYMYAIEMRVPSLDEDENNLLRVAWLRADGQFDHMDEVNMGKNVNYAQVYILSHCLQPGYFHSDANQEYMLLIKRATETTALREELLIAQAVSEELPSGRDLLLLGPDDECGILSTIMTVSGETNRLMVSYTKDGDNSSTIFAQHFYELPLDNPGAGIGDIVAPGAAEADPTAPVEYYNLQGIRVTEPAAGSGLYIKRQGRAVSKVVL